MTCLFVVGLVTLCFCVYVGVADCMGVFSQLYVSSGKLKQAC